MQILMVIFGLTALYAEKSLVGIKQNYMVLKEFKGKTTDVFAINALKKDYPIGDFTHDKTRKTRIDG